MNRELLEKFFNNDLSPGESEKVIRWLENNHDHSLYREFFSNRWNSAQPQPEKWDAESSWQLFSKKYHLEVKEKMVHLHPKTKKVYQTNWFRAAAVMMIFLGITIWLIQTSNFPTRPSEKAIQQITKSTERGQKLTVFLKDGSKVILNAASSLTYPETFSDSNRLVNLQGEAFFEVAHNVNKPFLVRSGGVEVKVLGTSFNVNQNAEQIEVALVSGKVKLDPNLAEPGEDLILLPGEAVQVRSVSDEIIKMPFDLNLVTGWKEGKLIFRKARFGEIMDRLEMWYGVDFKIENIQYLNDDQHYSGKFHNESLQNVLESIGFTKDFDFEITGESVRIKFKPKYSKK